MSSKSVMIGDLGNCYRLVSHSVTGLLKKKRKTIFGAAMILGKGFFALRIPLRSLMQGISIRVGHKNGK